MYNKISYKMVVAFDILMSLDKNYNERFDSSEEMYKQLKFYVNDFNKKDNDDTISWYDSFNNYLVNKITGGSKMKKTIVMLADENQTYECYIDENNKYWNGWLNPYFNKKNKDKFIKDMLKDLEARIFSDNKNNHKLISDLLGREFNYNLNFHSMKNYELLKFFFDFFNGKTEYMFDQFPKDVLNTIVEVIGIDDFEFINELYQTKKGQNNLYYFGSCYCWIEDKGGSNE